MHVAAGSRCALVLALVGCGSPPAPQFHEPVATLVAPTASAAPVAIAAPKSAHVDAHGCTFAGTSTDRFALGFDAASPATGFALVQTPEPVQLVLGATHGAPSSLQAYVFGLAFDAQTPENGVPLHARAPLGLAGVYDPAAYVRVHWQLLATASAEPGLLASAKSDFATTDLTKRITCTEVGFDAKTSFPARALPARVGWALALSDLALAPSPDASEVAQLPKGRVVAVHGSKGDFTEISMIESGLWHGWVPATSLKKVGSSPAAGYGSGSGRARPMSYAGFSCPAALPLYVRDKTSQMDPVQVGLVRANAHVGLAAASDSCYRVLTAEQRETSADAGQLTVQPLYELVVDQAASAACVLHTAALPDPALEGPDSNPAKARFTLAATPAQVAVGDAADLVFENLDTEPFHFHVDAITGCSSSHVALEVIDSHGAQLVPTGPVPHANCAITHPAHVAVYPPGASAPTKLHTNGPWFSPGAKTAAEGHALKPGTYTVVVRPGGGLELRTTLVVTAKK